MTSFAATTVSTEEVGAKQVPGGHWWVVLEDTSEQRVQAVSVILQVEDEDSVLIAAPGKTCSDTMGKFSYLNTPGETTPGASVVNLIEVAFHIVPRGALRKFEALGVDTVVWVGPEGEVTNPPAWPDPVIFHAAT